MKDKHASGAPAVHTEDPAKAFKKGDAPDGGINPADERPFVVFYTPETENAPEIIAVFNPSTPDRTEAIKGLAGSPIPFLRNSFDLLHSLGAKTVGIACNTMHYWLNRQMDENPDSLYPKEIATAHMIEGTADVAAERKIKTVGLLATTGTTNTKLYQDACRARDISVITLGQKPKPDSDWLDAKGRVKKEFYQQHGVKEDGSISEKDFSKLKDALVELLGEQEGLVMESIYGVFGIKAGYTTGAAKMLMDEAAERLVERGADALILGCTEVPLVLEGKTKTIAGKKVALIDTTQVVADRLAAAGKEGLAVGIAGGLGPAATIDMLQKMGVEKTATDFLTAIYNETIAQLRQAGVAITDREHVKFIFLQAREENMPHYQRLAIKMGHLFYIKVAKDARQHIPQLVTEALAHKKEVRAAAARRTA